VNLDVLPNGILKVIRLAFREFPTDRSDELVQQRREYLIESRAEAHSFVITGSYPEAQIPVQ
jgi:hypothetical protein